MPTNNASLVISIAAAVVSAASWWVNLRRSKADAVFKIIDLMERSRPARRVVYTIQSKELSQWSEAEKCAADEVARAFDIMGVLQAEGFAPESFFKRFYAVSLHRCWMICKPLIERDRRERNQPMHLRSFELAASRAIKLRPDAAV